MSGSKILSITSQDTYSQFNENFIKNCEGVMKDVKEWWRMWRSDEGYFLEVYVQNPLKLYELHNDWPFLSKRGKIEKVEKLATN